MAIDDLHLNGKLTPGENLADNGGIKLALRALGAREHSSPPVAGFSEEQRFLLAYAQELVHETPARS